MSFIATFKKSLQTLNQQDFTKFTVLALDLFRFQATNNTTYHLYIKHLGINPAKITKLTEIPFMPIEFFKTHKILSHEIDLSGGLKPPDSYANKPAMIFESSKTTGHIASCHHVLDTDFYLQNAERIFNSFYGNLADYHLLALLPSYLERQTSSLVYMVQGFMDKTSSFSGFYLDNFEELATKLQQLQDTKQKILLIGVTFALLDFAEQFPIKLPHAIIMETGGMKGRRAELLREEVHQILTSAFACDAIHSEYGMTELLSQGYSKGQGIFELPPTMRVFIRNITDPFEINGNFRDGGINIIDLANVESCAFIETKDIGCFANDKKTTFKVLGRYDNSEVRGCNLLVF